MQGMGRLLFRFFAVALIMLSFASCGGDTDVERIGAMEISEQGTLIQWYAIGADIGEAELRVAADAELKGLGLDRRVELIYFRDRSMAESFAKAEEDREEIELGFFDPTVALATSGGALIIRDTGSDPVWNWFPAPGEVK